MNIIKNTKIFFLLIAAFLLLETADAKASIKLGIDAKKSYQVGESIVFDYSILSDKDAEITYFIHVKCPNAPTSFIAPLNQSLKRNVLFKKEYVYLSEITDNIEPQDCTIYLAIDKPAKTSITKNFSIKTNPSFEFNLFTCKDQQCQDKSKTFIKNNNVYVNYESEVKNPEISAKLISPNKREQNINLPYSFKAERPGTYNLEATYSKEGYKTKTLNYQFAVIEKEPEIAFTGVCNANGICDEKEDSQNCPQDCSAGTEKERGFFQRFKIGTFLLIALALLGIIFLIQRVRRARETF